MIITISGKPCTGKSTMAEVFVKKFDFERVYAGGIFKAIAKERNIDILELVSSGDVEKVDFEVDERLKKIYEERLEDNILIESRTAWSFMPRAFNVFIDVSDDVMAERLFNSDRGEVERGRSIFEAKDKLMNRYNTDVERYKRLYGIDCSKLSNYDFVIDNSNLTPEETAIKIYDAYIKFIKK